MRFRSQLLADASGSIGGATASKNRGGNYFRRRRAPVNPNTARQVEVRSTMAGLNQFWMALTSPERAAWQTYADAVPPIDNGYGAVIRTGQNQYLRSNIVRLQAGLTRIDAAPTTYNYGVPVVAIHTPVFNVDSLAISFQFSLNVPTDEAGDVVWYISRPYAPSRNFYRGPFQFAKTLAIASSVDFVNESTNVSALASEYAPEQGAKSSIRAAIAYDDGRVSIPVIIPIDWTFATSA